MTRSWGIDVPVPRKRADTIRLHKKGVAVKKHFLAVTLAVSLLLTGCSSLLEREYADIAPHNTAPTEEGDPSIRRADSYQELVNILIYLVDAGTEHETIRLYMDSDKVEADLAAACLEVTREDPLGAYAVDFIRYDISRVVAYSQADVEIAYRRSREQVDSIVRATGVTAIRGELESALSSFAPSRTLRVSYFDGDEELIRALARQAYYNVPAAALGMPELEIYLYPDSGRQRIIEVLAAYPLEPARLEQRREALARRLEDLARPLAGLEPEELALEAAEAIREEAEYDPSGPSDAYSLLEEGRGDSEGLALACAALCQQLGLPCQVVQGAIGEEPRFWNIVQLPEGWRHIDLTREEPGPLTDPQLEELGYVWDREGLPSCPAPKEE